MHDDMGVEFGCREINQQISCTFVGTSIWDAHVPRKYFCCEIQALEIWLLEEFPGNAGSVIPKLPWPVGGDILSS